MIFLALHDFLVAVDLWDGHDHFALPLLDVCIDGCSFLLYCVSPRTSPSLGRRPLVCFVCCWLCSCRFFSSFLQIFVFLSLSSYSCCFTSFFSPQARWLWCRVGFSPLLGCGSFCASSSESLCGRLRLRASFLASLQHHYSALSPS